MTPRQIAAYLLAGQQAAQARGGGSVDAQCLCGAGQRQGHPVDRQGIAQMRLVARDDTPGQWVKATTEYERIIAKGATQAMRKVGQAGGACWTQGDRECRIFRQCAAHLARHQQAEIRALCSTRRFIFIRPSIIWMYSRPAKPSPDHHWLWLPLPNVPPNPGSGVKFGGLIGRPHMTPRQYIAKVGPLITMHRPGKPPMLGAVVEIGGRPTRRRLRSTFLKATLWRKDASDKGRADVCRRAIGHDRQEV